MKKLIAVVFFTLIFAGQGYAQEIRVSTAAVNQRPADRAPMSAGLQGPIMPEVATPVVLSASDVNRISCPGPVKELLFSQEKPIEGKFIDSNVFIKFKVKSDIDGSKELIKEPAEFFIVCGGNVYNLIGYPRPVKAVTLRLQSSIKDKIKKNKTAYAGLPTQKAFLKLIREAYLQDFPANYDIYPKNKNLDLSGDLQVKLVREIRVVGEGIGLLELEVNGVFKAGGKTIFKLQKETFMTTRVYENIRAITIVDNEVTPGKSARVFVAIDYEGSSS